MSVDERVMNELVGRKIPIEDFEEEIGKVLKQKSGAKLLISNKPDMIKGADGEFHVIEQRLTQAAQLLLEGDWNVSEVAAIVGYGKPSNFAAAFKKKYGVSPKNYPESRFV